MKNNRIIDIQLKQSNNIKSLLKGSGWNWDYAQWKAAREIILRPIDKGGSILDMGCANGFLLFCLQRWSGLKLIPYGVDIKPELIKEAKSLFPEHSSNFFVGDAAKVRLKEKFDYIIDSTFCIMWYNRRNVRWYHRRNKDLEIKKYLDKCYNLLKIDGKLIICAYVDVPPSSEFESFHEYTSRLGYPLSGRGITPNGLTFVMWFKKGDLGNT